MSVKLNILITGANGFIGSRLLKYFSEKKELRVTGLVRETSNLFRFGDRRYELLYASINDPLKEITKGFDAVIHTAAKSSDWGNYDGFYKNNVEGAVNLITASIQSGVRRFIHFSSTVVYGFKGNLKTPENKVKNPFNNNYCLTKSLAEEKLTAFKERIELIILRPSNVFGRMDTTFTYPFFKTIENGLFGWPNGGRALTSPCYVKNLVSATEKALYTVNGIGEAYNITDGYDIPWSLFLSMAAEAIKVKPPRFPVPSRPLFIISWVLDNIYKLAGSKKPPVITPYRIAMTSKDYSFSIEKARSLLKYTPPYTTEEGIQESAGCYHEYKKILDGHLY